MAVRLLALDLALGRTGICRFTKEGGYQTETLKPKTADEVTTGISKLTWYANRLREIAETERPTLVGIENYAMGGRAVMFHSFAKGELGGVARVEFARVGATIVLIPPKTAKKFLTGRGDAEKVDVSADAVRLLGAAPVKNTDEGDAAALAYFLRSWSMPAGLQHWQHEMLTKCEVHRPAIKMRERHRPRGHRV